MLQNVFMEETKMDDNYKRGAMDGWHGDEDEIDNQDDFDDYYYED